MRRLALLTLMLLGCARADLVARGPCRDDGDCRAGSCLAGVCVATDAGPDASADAGFCAGRGPLVLVGDQASDARCSGSVAQTTFRYAVCTCTSLTLSNDLATDAFDSRLGAYTTGATGGSVGSNGPVQTNGALDVGGRLLVSDPGGFVLGASGGLSVRDELRIASPISGTGAVQVIGDAYVGGDLQAAALQIGGTLTLPADATIDVAPGPLSAPDVVRASLAVADPCDCDTPPLDVAAIVAAHADANDDARAGLTPGSLAQLEASRTLDLDCGRYAFDSLGAGAGVDLTLRVHGRVAVFVAGDVRIEGSFRVELVDEGELDLFVAGTIDAGSALVLGDALHPARARLYVGGAAPITLDAGALVAGNLYARRATIFTSGPLEVFGSVFADAIVASGALRVHYDVAVLGAAEGCAPPDEGCASCLDCDNQACVGSACGLCASDADCCSPLRCVAGNCIVELE